MLINKDLIAILSAVQIYPISHHEHIQARNIVQRVYESWWRYYLLVHEKVIISATLVAYVSSVIVCLSGGLFYFFEFNRLGKLAVGTALAVFATTLIVTIVMNFISFNIPVSYRNGMKAERYKVYLPETSQRYITILREHTQIALDFSVNVQRFVDEKTRTYTDFCTLWVQLGQKEALIYIWTEKDSDWL